MIRIEKYISFVYADEEEKLESPFQYKTEHPRAYYENNIEALRDELDRHFWYIFYQADLEKSEKEDFLDYHLGRYTGPGMNFMDFVRRMPMLPMEVNECVMLDYSWRMGRRTYISDWIEKRQKEADRRKGEGGNINTGKKPPQDGKNAKPAQNLGSPAAREKIKPNKLTLVEIESHLMERLTAVSKYTGKQIMTKGQVQYLISANIETEDGEDVIEAVKIKTDGHKNEIQAAIYDLYKKNEPDYAPSMLYCEMALDNFKEFNRITCKLSFQKNFSKCS